MTAFARHWKHLPIWRLNVAIWCAFTALFFLRLLLHLDLPSALALSVFQLALCLLLTSLLQVAYRHLERTMSFQLRTAAWIIGLSLAATIIQSTLAHGLVSITGWKNPGWSLLELWLMRVMFFWLVYMVWSLLYFWLRAEQAAQTQSALAEQARGEAQRMELQLLRSQLDPHFLFNALNGIATVVENESPGGSSMVRELADYLRYSLDHRHDTMVPLASEIEAMMAYLRIEQARFSEELHVEITTDDTARQRAVPCFILLPLVENAVKHSYQDAEPPWHVVIAAESRDETLSITVRNPGVLREHPSGAQGVGLDVLRRRLDLHYPDRHRLDLTSADGVVTANLELQGDPCSG